ncbi:hypothetical protein Q1695_000685 [Nippostrongylus brasiliensis]|nr:hypothetical protein Q1695_000685 [Nippostrongylus brasiliensis]
MSAGYVEEHRPRSQSADTRRHSYVQRRGFSEDHGGDFLASEVGNFDGYDGMGSLRRGTHPHHVVSSYDDTATLRRSTNAVQFPSSYREQHQHRVDEQQQSSAHHHHQQKQQQQQQQQQQQFNSAAHNFTQHLRERSPSSSSALLNLLSRYPSAKQSVYSSTSTAAAAASTSSAGGAGAGGGGGGGNSGITHPQPSPRIYRFDDRPVDTHSYRPTDAVSGYPLVELSVPKSPKHHQQLQQQQQQQHPQQQQPLGYLNVLSGHRTQSLPLNGGQQQQQPRENSSLSASVYSEFSSSHSPTFSQSSGAGDRATLSPSSSPATLNGFATLRRHQYHHLQQQQQQNSIKPKDFASQPKFYNDSLNNNNNINNNNINDQQLAHNKRWEELLDVTQLDSLLASVLEDNMNRSTSEWSNSFAQVQNRFKNLPPETSDSGLLHGFTSSGAPTLPRKGMMQKSASHNDMNRTNSVLNSAIERRAAEAPELRKSGAIDNFWSHTVNSRPSSPTIQRIAGNLTAAERLQMLQEDANSPTSTLNRPGSGSQLAARREHYLHEALSASNYTPPHREAVVAQQQRPGTPAVNLRGPSPNFSDLDNAVQELQCGVRSTGYSHGARRLGGCARFPTDEHALSPPRTTNIANISRKMNSPSPTDSTSETSSVYQIPTGLPHPKPKHNIKEQLTNAGVQTHNFFRTGVRAGPNFPVPVTGSVASRITEFEKRPGTPTLQIATAPRLEKSPVSNGPMSPKSTVYKSKAVIHVETGSRSPRSLNNTGTVFDFPAPTSKWNEKTTATLELAVSSGQRKSRNMWKTSKNLGGRGGA